jgi:hypothetical protein
MPTNRTAPIPTIHVRLPATEAQLSKLCYSVDFQATDILIDSTMKVREALGTHQAHASKLALHACSVLHPLHNSSDSRSVCSVHN